MDNALIVLLRPPDMDNALIVLLRPPDMDNTTLTCKTLNTL